MVHLTSWVALAAFVSRVSTTSFHTGQAPLSQPRSFIKKSIFGQRQDLAVGSHDEFTIEMISLRLLPAKALLCSLI